MNKGIIMEKHRKYTIVLTRDGIFQKAVPIQHAGIGEEVEFEPLLEKHRSRGSHWLGKHRFSLQFAGAAAVLLLFAIPLYFMSSQHHRTATATYAYLNIDINPSIELQVDDHLKVRDLTPLNEDAKTLISHLHAKEGEDLNEVVNNIMAESEKRDLIANGKKMLVGVSYANGKRKDVSVTEHLNQALSKEKMDWKIATYRIPVKIRNLAREKNKSANELVAKEMFEPESDEALMDDLSEKDKAIIHSFYQEKERKKTKELKQKPEQETDTAEQPEEKNKVDPTNQQSSPSKPATVQDEQKPTVNQPVQQKKTAPEQQGGPKGHGQQNNKQGNQSQVQQRKTEPKPDYRQYQNNNPYRNNEYKNEHRKRGEEYRQRNEQYRNQQSHQEDDDGVDD